MKGIYKTYDKYISDLVKLLHSLTHTLCLKLMKRTSLYGTTKSDIQHNVRRSLINSSIVLIYMHINIYTE